jgi:lycopene beta-cyclase
MDQTNRYDYIIAGAGCAGLSLVVRLINSGKFADKKILILDNRTKNTNDRTWCFWESTPGYFEHLVYKKWNAISFKANAFDKDYQIAPYQYKMIRAIDFYSHCVELIAAQKNITRINGTIEDLSGNEGDTWVQYDGRKVYADHIFNSILFQKPPPEKNEFLLLQHFKGWLIETSGHIFDPATAIFMDFRTGQHNGTTFVYVMPLATNKALVEYTLFTHSLLKQGDYETGLRDYLLRMYPAVDYKILEEEFGVIPMTNHFFPPSTGNIIHIGTAGGQTKASTGYTFKFIQQHSDALTNALIKGQSLSVLKKVPGKFHFYDSVLLNVLSTGKVTGEKVFTDLFSKNDPGTIFRFLDNESTFTEDLRIISSLPVIPFLKAAIRQLF